MIIELIGLPGAGKTTFAKSLNSELVCEICFNHHGGSWAKKALFVIRNLSGVNIGLKTAKSLGVGPGSSALFLRCILAGIRVRAYLKKRDQCQNSLCDQGPIQELIALCMRSGGQVGSVTHELLQFYAEPSIDYLYIDTPLEVIVKRLLHREDGTSPADSLDGAVLWQYLRARKAVTEKIIGSLLALNCRVIRTADPVHIWVNNRGLDGDFQRIMGTGISPDGHELSGRNGTSENTGGVSLK